MNIFLIWAISYVVAFVLLCLAEIHVDGELTIKDILLFSILALTGIVIIVTFVLILAPDYVENHKDIVIYRKKQKGLKP